jgi:predicted SnoaL-like aldol condensation-catalyzing enzyme
MRILLILAALTLAAASSSAQYPVPQQTSYAMNAEERANLELVHDWWRDIMNGQNIDIAAHYMPTDFISRNPNVAAGRDAFIATLRSRPDLLQNRGQTVPEVELADGNYVFLMWANFVIDPMAPAHIYKYNTLDLFRIDGGKIVEHWDGARKVVEEDLGEKSLGGGVYENSMNLSARERETRRLGIVEFKDILQYGHVDLAMQVMAPGYMQHNPNVPGGRENFVEFFSSRARDARPLSDEWITPPTLEIVSGNYYLKFDERFEEDPGNPSRQTAYYRFDMVRVDDGRIQEHWDVAFPSEIER